MRILPSMLAFAVVSFAMSLSLAQDSSQPAPVTAAGGPLPAAAAPSFPPVVALGDPIDGVSPKYPKQAMKQNLQGAVVLNLSVAKNGRVESVAVVSGDPVLADAATHAVRKWKYVPYFRNDQPVEVQTTITINFRITDQGKPDISAKYNVPSEPTSNEVFKIGNGVTVPRLAHNIDPEYSEEARQAKYQGTCVLSLVVGPDGRPRDIKVARALGKGLDEKAIEAVRQWRFVPATKGGQPVAVMINVEVQFRLN
jgi:TonB family protein